MARLKDTHIFGYLKVDGEIKNKASTTSEGVVKLNDSVTSGSTTEAATARAVKQAYGMASHAHPYVPLRELGNTTAHADSDASSTSEYFMIKAGHNELKVTSSGGGTTVTKGQDKLTFNDNVVYHEGKKPTPAEIGAAEESHGEHVPPKQGADHRVFLRNDNTWQIIRPEHIGAACGSLKTGVTRGGTNWYRIAQSPININNNIGEFYIRASAPKSPVAYHSSTIITAGVSYGQNPILQQISHTTFHDTGISKARIVYDSRYVTRFAYLEIYVPTEVERTITVQLVGDLGWTLVDPGTVADPIIYDGVKEITLETGKIVSDINGTVNGHTISKSVPSNAVFTDTIYKHPETSGNKHIPSGGLVGQVLKWSADGTAVWGSVEGKDGTIVNIVNGEQTTKATNVNFISTDGAIKTIETTDNEGHKISSSFATDTSHITDRTGRTQDIVNHMFYKQACEKFTSNGKNIIINNGLDGYMLSGKIEGRTVRNYATIHVDGKNPSRYTPLSFDIELNKTYTIVFEQLDGVSDYGFICLTKGNTRLTTPYNTKIQISNKHPNGVRFGVVQTNYVAQMPADGEFRLEIGAIPNAGTISDKIIILEGDCTDGIDYYTFDSVGLSSTKATFTNNGEKYSFYASEEDKAQGKVIELNGIDANGWNDSATPHDRLEINEDGSGNYIQNIFKVNIKGTEGFTQVFLSKNGTHVVYNLPINYAAYNVNSVAVVDKYRFKMWIKGFNEKLDETYVGYPASTRHLCISLPVEIAPTVEDLKKYLQETGGFEMVGQLKKPIVTHIPKELMPPIIRTYEKNNFSFGEGAKPNKATIKVPVDRIGDLEAKINTKIARLEALESALIDVALDK